MAVRLGAVTDNDFKKLTSSFDSDMQDLFIVIADDIEKVIHDGVKENLSAEQIQENVNKLFFGE